ncbi:hypothetical protein GDO86_004647, partial [Hymenochirus boettgeri]
IHDNPNQISLSQSMDKRHEVKSGVDCIQQKKFKNKNYQHKRMNVCLPSLCKGSVELVHLVSVVNPCNFYIRRYVQIKQFVFLDKTLKHFGSKDRPVPTDILELGEIIAVRSEEQKSWCRCKITQLIPLDSKFKGKPCGPSRYRIENITIMKVFLLDFGSSEVFSSARYIGTDVSQTDEMILQYTVCRNLCDILRKLHLPSEAPLKSVPPLAVHCSLVDIAPANAEGWKNEAKEEFLKFVRNKCVQMKVIREENGKFFVDLRNPHSNKRDGNMPASIRDALVFLDLARFHLTGTPVKSMLRKCYDPPSLPEHKTEYTVAVANVNNPSDFYIHVVDNTEYLSFVNKMQEVYNGKESEHLKIMFPAIGQVCIAMFEDGLWYRAQVVGFSQRQEVEVKYVDFGNVAKVNTRNLREPKEEFLALPCKAIWCRLAFIEPCENSQVWSLEACKLFEDMVSDTFLKCKTIGVFLDNKLSVELFLPENDTSVNALLVENNAASFIPGGQSLGNPHSRKKEVWETLTNLEYVSITAQNKMDTQDVSLLKENALDVRICHVVSPSKIYVQWLSSEKCINSMESKMFKKYGTTNPETIHWKMDMNVAVQLPVLKQWRRGKITKIVSDNLVEVYYYDYGILDSVDVINIRTLEECLQDLSPMCLECSLTDIKPTGGSENWTATACDVLSYYLNGAVGKIIIEENASQWPLPVKLLRNDEAGQEVDISNFLVRKGLALKIRRSESKNVEEENENPSSVTEVYSDKDPESKEAMPKQSDKDPESEEAMPKQSDIDHYLPPVLPDTEIFSAKVSFVEDGTIYVIPESSERELTKMMSEIQNSFKCIGLLLPYNWKKGEGCIINGSDSRLYRGIVLEILGGDMMRVKYVDFGYTEKILKCHASPNMVNVDIPLCCIPCQLHKTLPVGEKWQTDTIELLKELLLERYVKVHIMEPPAIAGGIASVHIYCNGASVSAILGLYSHCVPTNSDKLKLGMLSPDLDTLFLPGYTMPKIPPPGVRFPVTVRHIITPNEVKIPCLATYIDDKIYRAKLLTVSTYDPLTFLVEFVDYGSTKAVESNRLFQLPPELIQYPLEAIKVRLSGFKASAEDLERDRLPYRPEWSFKAMTTMMDILQVKKLSASVAVRIT